ncbi:hypothetical protein VC83_08749 [Pseudogymnoascus destructans]|uniref:Uncharacterized protein n=1 Tax=Pseudogymnoascus destructans TaxID=655981 RepID=A0A177A194_9PEZI|nr:uncharacterized protein VC83_08749 [Pseudogymnoascus destructans]OAF55051.1 hypothetical protein VC83_08749 [Pseudogymnoascus destructans]
MSRAAAAAANAAAHTAAERVLHIRAHPTPVTMAARQRVLVALESFGEVEHFRSLKHHPTTPTTSAFHAILPPTASRALLAASPLTIPLTQPAPESQSPGPYQENLTLTIRPSPHLPPLSIRSSPIYGPYTPTHPRHSAITADLLGRVPPGVAQKGLCDWESDAPRERRAWGVGLGSGGVPWRIRRREKEGGGDRWMTGG